MRIGHLVFSALWSAACGSPTAALDGGIDVPGHNPGTPGVGAHAMTFYHLDASTASSISTSAMATQAKGSTIVVGVGRGYNPLFALPTDSRGNTPYRQLDALHSYTRWPDSGTAAYAFTSASGGAGFTVSTTTGRNQQGQYDEVTLAAIEVVEGIAIQDTAWTEVLDPPHTSGSVTTTGPATLIAFWWGDGFPGTPQSATPDNGFTLIDTNAQERDSFVQCAVAVKNVTAAGNYRVTWTATPTQGAQLWLIAVQ
jgi:hypothetical protein